MPIQIKLNKVHRNDVDFLRIKITPNKVRPNNVHVLFIELHPKTYVEMTKKFVEILTSTYRSNIHGGFASIQHVVSVGYHKNIWFELVM